MSPAIRAPGPGGSGRRAALGRADLSIRAEAGISALALPWLAGEQLAAGLLTDVVAGVLIVVPVRLASRR